MLGNKFPCIRWSLALPCSIYYNQREHRDFSQDGVYGLQLKKHMRGCLSKNVKELPRPPSPTSPSHREAPAMVTNTRAKGTVATELHRLCPCPHLTGLRRQVLPTSSKRSSGRWNTVHSSGTQSEQKNTTL